MTKESDFNQTISALDAVTEPHTPEIRLILKMFSNTLNDCWGAVGFVYTTKNGECRKGEYRKRSAAVNWFLTSEAMAIWLSAMGVEWSYILRKFKEERQGREDYHSMEYWRLKAEKPKTKRREKEIKAEMRHHLFRSEKLFKLAMQGKIDASV